MHEVTTLARYVVFTAFVVSVVAAVASWLVRTRRVSPFGPLGRTLRSASDPLIRPVETRLLRVIASWFGFFRYARWMRPAYLLTDWLIEPIRRVLPSTGTIDWSPLAAWLALWVLERILLSLVAVF